jgi:hypothetical protein
MRFRHQFPGRKRTRDALPASVPALADEGDRIAGLDVADWH